MLSQIQPGQTAKQPFGLPVAGAGEYADTLVTELMPRYYEQAYRGNVYVLSNQAAVAVVTAGITTQTGTGLALINPPTSNKNIVLLQVEYTIVATGATSGVVALAVSPYSSSVVTNTTSAQPRSVPSYAVGTGVATGTTSWGWPAASIVIKPLFNLTSTASITQNLVTTIDVGGSLVFGPGTSFGTTGTLAVSGLASFVYMEVPL